MSIRMQFSDKDWILHYIPPPPPEENTVQNIMRLMLSAMIIHRNCLEEAQRCSSDTCMMTSSTQDTIDFTKLKNREEDYSHLLHISTLMFDIDDPQYESELVDLREK